MKWIDNAGQLWHKLWSLRLSAAAGLSSLYAGWEAHVYGQPAWACLLTAGLAFAAAFSRVVAQPKATGTACDG